MYHKLVVVLYLCIASVCSAPMQLAPNLQSSPMNPQQQPLVIVVPNAAVNPTADDRNLNLSEQIANLKSHTGHVDENKEAVVVDAPKAEETNNVLVYLPQETRFSLAQLISFNPFLPKEINVPDKIKLLIKLFTPSQWFKPKGQVPLGETKTLGNSGQLPVIVMPYTGPVAVNQ